MFHKNKFSKAAMIFLLVFLSNIALAEIALLCPEYLDDLNILAPNASLISLNVESKERPALVLADESEANFHIHSRREIILQTNKIKKTIKTVLYPASGSDAITAIRMFSKATVIIGIDNNEFTSSTTKLRALDETKNRNSYDIYYNVKAHQKSSIKQARHKSFEDYIRDKENYDDHFDESSDLNIVELIVTDISGHFRESEIISVELLNIPALDDESKISVSGRIIFKETKDGPVKTYYHIHRPTTIAHGPNDPAFDYLADNIIQFGFDAIVVKASMASLYDASGQMFLNHIFDNGGLIVDGDSVESMSTYKIAASKAKDFVISREVLDLRKTWGPRSYKFGYEPFVTFISVIKTTAHSRPERARMAEQ